MKKNSLTILWAIVFLTGCANPPGVTHLLASSTPTLMIKTTPTMTLLPELTTAATPGSTFIRQCLQIGDREVELKEVTSGTILLSHFEPDLPPAGKDVFSMKDVQTGNEYKLTIGSAYLTNSFLQVSPNRKMIAQMEQDINDQLITTRNILWVFDARANILSKIIFDRTDLGQPRWLDDERLLIDTGKYGNLLLVNPFTGEQRVISDALPDLFPNFKNSLWWPVVYSPDLELAAYYSARTENGDYMEGPVVYDLVKKKTLWGAANGVGSDPAWSPDGQEVAFTGGMNEHQLYLISRSGQVKAVLGEEQPHESFAFSWSPDGHYIAFWNADSLMIYDRQMDWVFDTCIPGTATSNPDWSPDSQKVIVNAYSSQPILVDWQKKIAYKIKDTPNRVIYEWMNALP